MRPRSFIVPIQHFVSRKTNATVLLFVMAVLAAIIANTPLVDDYEKFLNLPITLQIGAFNVFSYHGETMNLLTFANDVLMVLFFLNVGLEIKREGLVGELSTVRKALFPVTAAVGGMIFPIFVFFAFCHTHPESNGAAIPMATDIAFSLAVLSLVKGVPTSLKTFLTALAVADDLGGIIVIAVFYTSNINLTMLLYGIGVIILLYLLGRYANVRQLWVYYLGLLFVWIFFLSSGVHTTIAGVLVALTVPSKPRYDTTTSTAHVRTLMSLLHRDDQTISKGTILLPEEQINVLNSISHYSYHSLSPMQRLETQLTPIVNWIILPLFAFVNAGVKLGNVSWEDLGGITSAVALGLIIGKPLGIFLFSKLYLWITRTPMPVGMHNKSLLGLGLLGGFGFTVSLFIASLSYVGPESQLMLNEAKLGIFVGSIFSGIFGYLFLNHYFKNHHDILEEQKTKNV